MNINKTLIKKVIILSVMLFGVLSIHGTSSAYEVFEGETKVKNGHYTPHQINGDWTFCTQYGKHYQATWSRSEESQYPEGSKTNQYCSKHNSNEKPWEDYVKYSMEYSYAGAVSTEENQDAAYILWKDQGKYAQDPDQWAIWSTALAGSSSKPNDLGTEGLIYKNFYNEFHVKEGNTYKDKFKDRIEDLTDYDNIEIGINYNDGTYIVGPFHYKFPDGTLNGKNRFSWVNKVIVNALNENEEITEIESSKIKVLNKNKQVLSDYGKNGKESLNDIDFYIEIESKDALKIGIKLDYGYIESYSCVLTKYEGHKVFRNWKYVTDGLCPDQIGTGYYIHYWWRIDPDTGEYQVSQFGNAGWTEVFYEETQVCKGKLYHYELEKTNGEQTQTILHLSGSAKENEKNVIKGNEDDETPIDLQMELAGYVFLDEKEGKKNEGNNKLDDGEGIRDTDVWVYKVDRNDKKTLVGIYLTDQNGYYTTGKKLNSMYKYFVKFNYNGMLYEAVEYNMDAVYNSTKWTKTSKAQELKRQEFNNKFAEIGSYPLNYKIEDKMFGNDLGDYNKIYQQEDIVYIFKQLSKAVVDTNGDLKEACEKVSHAIGNSEEMKRKIQFAADCRMTARTDRKEITIQGADTGYVYPVYTTTPFTIIETTEPITIAGVTYKPIYEGQRFINFGIKTRPTVDLALYKDVQKAEVSINGKTQTYTYDFLNDIDGTGFAIGISEKDYLNGLRGAYKESIYYTYTNDKRTRDIDQDKYELHVRSEEITNGVSFNALNPYELNENDKLNIEVVYKIAIINQSSTTAAVTEIVDYYDNNFEFVSAYVGDKDGNKTGEVKKYGDSPKYALAQFESSKGAYKTMYLVPETENRLDNNEQQYIYVRLRLVDNTRKQNTAGELLSSILKNETDTLTILNIAEINAYKTYNSKTDSNTPGLIDIDSIPGNLNISNIDALTQENIINYPNIRDMYEDDTRRAPALIFGKYEARTLSGTVFEDNINLQNGTRQGNGILEDGETKIQGVIVDLYETKNGADILRARTTTNENGDYAFIGFIPGDYKIKYTYGYTDDTSMTTTSKWYQGLNIKSYNGQDFQSTVYQAKQDKYWYTESQRLSDAQDDLVRVTEVMNYSKKYGNYKANVFKSYEAEQASYIDRDYNRKLANELEANTHRYAYTTTIPVEVEYATTQVKGNQSQEKYAHNIVGIDFGIVERPHSELILHQKIARIKVISSDGTTVLFDADGTQNVSNLNWIKGANGELANVILDEELMNGAKIQITWTLIVSNTGENDNGAKTSAETIIDYVSNNLDFDKTLNPAWELVNIGDIVKAQDEDTLVNSKLGIDLSTQATIIKTNALSQTLLSPGQSTAVSLTLSKVISTDNTIDSFSYSNIAEMVEIGNEVGRYDRGAVPGNQDPSQVPQEHDSAADGTIIVTPPTGSQYIYYIIGITSLAILAVGIILIKKFVMDKNK